MPGFDEKNMTEDGWVAGVDGCPGGWIAVFRRVDGSETCVRMVAGFREVACAPERPRVVAVDMPVGLPDRAGRGGRGPEAALRPLLGQRQSSVFSIPSRAAVYAADYAEASQIAFETSDPPRRIAKQTFFLTPKIREIDTLLRLEPELRDRVVETHPEGAFMAMNGFRPLLTPKKLRGAGNPPGQAERRGLLSAVGRFGDDVLTMRPPRGAAVDDLLDACACCWTAGRVHLGSARRYPAEPATDALGILVAIHV